MKSRTDVGGDPYGSGMGGGGGGLLAPVAGVVESIRSKFSGVRYL